MLNKILGIVEKGIVSRSSKRAVIIGVNGIDASGKTKFAVSLSEYLSKTGHHTQLIHLDDFHNQKSIRHQGINEIDAYINNAFNSDLLINELLKPIRDKNAVDKKLTLLDLESDEYNVVKRFNIQKDTLVIVEGVLLFRPPLNDYFDYRIFLDISFDKMLKRASKRDIPRLGQSFMERYHTKYIPIQKWYLEKFEPAKISDLLIDNNDHTRSRIIKT
ncbi:MAG: hypothetical protein ABIE07_14160 [Candidatus Zixiibacteriota bacterium]